jgi:ferric-dicitrate binding protein FerR (iron transport regulator)
MSMTEPQFRDMLERYLQGKASPAEIRILDEFFASYHRQHPEDNGQHINPDLQSEILWKVHQRIGVEKNAPPFSAIPWLKIAASVLIIAVVWIFVDGNKILDSDESAAIVASAILHEQTLRGQKSELRLPDGTKVFLNANSSIHYPEKFTASSREVTVEGEAYFEVTHDASRPFVVNTRQTKTQVLGTSFNVKSQPDKNIEVTLVAGSVRVMASDKIILVPGEQAVVDHTSQALRRKTVDVNKYIGWKDNILYFEEVKLQDAVAMLEDWYDVNIEIKSNALRNCLITAKYQNESLENVLKSFQFLLQAKINRDDLKNIIITGNGCK